MCKIALFFLVLIFACQNHGNVKSPEKFVSKFRKPDYSKIVNYKVDLSKLIDSLNIDYSELHIDIDKSEYLLSIACDTILIKQYPIVLGKNPIDDKFQQGDFCTPEGWFNIKAKYNHDKWSKFIWIDYPNKESLNKISEAKKAGFISSTSNPGGDIGIHGVEQGFDYAIDFGINWTAGCVALKNKDIEEIYAFICDDTKILIHK